VYVAGRPRSGTVRKAEQADLPGIVTIHLEAFKNFFLTRLGRGFLQRYYELVLRYRAGILLVREGRSGLEGFACGFVDPEEFYGLMSSSRGMFALPILSAVLRHPSLLANIFNSVQRVEAQAAQTSARSCELSSVAVRPEARGKGAGKALLKAFSEQAWSLGTQYVYLDTDADDNEGANALYRNAGFQFCRRFQKKKGRWMNQYVLDRATANEGLGDVLHEEAASRS
jgi:ribosomal protein S18 acetylase RimI-like enzyme